MLENWVHIWFWIVLNRKFGMDMSFIDSMDDISVSSKYILCFIFYFNLFVSKVWKFLVTFLFNIFHLNLLLFSFAVLSTINNKLDNVLNTWEQVAIKQKQMFSVNHNIEQVSIWIPSFKMVSQKENLISLITRHSFYLHSPQ